MKTVDGRPRIDIRKAEVTARESNTGYTKDLQPDRLTRADAEAVPVATDSGKQEGVVPPAQREYMQTTETVTAEEALKRMHKRRLEGAAPVSSEHPDTSPVPDFEPFGTGVPPQPAAEQRVESPAPARRRVTLEMETGGTAFMRVIDVLVSRYAITLLATISEDGSVFIPPPGSRLTIVEGDRSWDCMFPGTYFESPRHKLLGLSFLKAEANAGDTDA